MNRSHYRMTHVVDLYENNYATNEMGQRVPDWEWVKQDQKCSYAAASSSTNIRITPTIEEADYVHFLFPHDAPVTYKTRIRNIRSSSGDKSEVIEEDEFQVMEIDKHISFTGRVSYMQVKAMAVRE